MNNNANLYKTLIIITAFILLGAGLQLSFKQNSVLTQSVAYRQSASANLANGTTTDPNKIDLPKASQATGLSVDQLQSIVSQIAGNTTGPGGCLPSSGGVKAIGRCNPPGPGRYTGNPFSPGRDLSPCQVTGLKGGEIVAMCWQGCCRSFSVTSAKKAFDLSNLSPEQMIQLGLKGFGLLARFGQLNYGKYGGNNDAYLGIDGTDTVGGDYFPGIDSETTGGAIYDFDTYSYEKVTASDTLTQSVFKGVKLKPDSGANPKPQINLSKELTDLPNSNGERLNLPDIYDPSDFAVADVPKPDETVYYEFQELSSNVNQDPRLDALRDPESSSVRKSLLNSSEVKYDAVNNRDKRGILQIIMDIILAPFR